MGRKSLALNDPKVVESTGKKIIKDLEKIIRVSKVPALTLFDLEKIRAQKEWKGSKVHANGLRTEEEESSSIVKSATKLENRKKFEQVDRGLVENSGQSNRKDFVRSTRQLTLSSLKASTIADPFESTPSTRKNISFYSRAGNSNSTKTSRLDPSLA
jgi:hypothetical protein